MEKNRDVYYYYLNEQEKLYYCLNEETQEVITMTPVEKADVDARFFEVNGNYECKEESLFEYMKEFNRCNDELKEFTKGYTDYKRWLNDGMSVMNYFKSRATRDLKKYDIKPTTVDEVILSEMCHNGGITYLDSKWNLEPIQCYGSDFTNCYGSFLTMYDVSNLLLPIKEGKWSMCDIDIRNVSNIKYGFYKLKISSDDIIVKKYFKFSQDNVYCHFNVIQLSILVNYVLRCKPTTPIDKIVQIDGNECYVYDEKDLVRCDKIFGNWFKDVSKLKENLKGNFLVKNLSTKLWGYLTQYLRFFVDEDEIQNYNYAPYHKFKLGMNEKQKFDYICIKVNSPTSMNAKYELVDVKKAYKQGGIARLKTFLIASVKLYMTRIILDNGLSKKVVRLCTDGIVLSEPYDFSQNKNYKYVPVSEEKTTGLIKWYNVNKYYHCCSKCGTEYKYEKNVTHKCKK